MVVLDGHGLDARRAAALLKLSTTPALSSDEVVGRDGADAQSALGEAREAQVGVGRILRLHDREQRVARLTNVGSVGVILKPATR